MAQDLLPPSELTPEQSDHRIDIVWLLAAAGITILLWQVHWGGYILYPFSQLATWFHEMSHGLTAMLLGGEFTKLQIFPNGAGLASYRGPVLFGEVGQALVSAGGPMGPSIAGAGLILASRRQWTARLGILGLGSLLLLSLVLWIRSLFGWVMIGSLGLVIMSLGLWSPRWLRAFTVQFLGVQACISAYHQIDYMFTAEVVVAGQRRLSDTGRIADYLMLPYWFWGGLMAVGSMALLFLSLRIAYRR